MLHTRMNRRRKHFVDKVHPAVCINYLFLYFEKRHGCQLRTRGSVAGIGTRSFKHSCGNMQWSICFLLIDALIQSKLRTVYMHFLYDILWEIKNSWIKTRIATTSLRPYFNQHHANIYPGDYRLSAKYEKNIWYYCKNHANLHQDHNWFLKNLVFLIRVIMSATFYEGYWYIIIFFIP